MATKTPFKTDKKKASAPENQKEIENRKRTVIHLQAAAAYHSAAIKQQADAGGTT